MKDAFYFLLRRVIKLFIWHGKASGRENLTASGPAVFLGNHCGPLGPIGSVCEVPQRLYPWTIWQMLDRQECPLYMQVDFVEKSLHLRPPLSAIFSRLLARLVVPLLNGIGCIPVFKAQGPGKAYETLEISLGRLLAGQSLLILPEVPEWEEDPQTKIHRFSRSALWLVDMYFEKTGQSLVFVPFVAHPTRRILFLSPRNLTPKVVNAAGGREDWMNALEQEIQEKYLEME